MKPLFRFRKVQIWNAFVKLSTNIKPTDIKNNRSAFFARFLHDFCIKPLLFPFYRGKIKAKLFAEKLDISKIYRTISQNCTKEGAPLQAQISGMQEKKPAALTEEAIESYLQSVASQGRTKGTLANYRRSLSKFFQWLPGEKLLS